MPSRDSALFRLAHKEFNESLGYYVPDANPFLNLAKLRLNKNWKIVRQGVWFHCISGKDTVPEQGWKIHLSTTRANAVRVLDIAMGILIEDGETDFKFALDMPTLALINSKNWSRGSAGKFVTIYPKDDDKFKLLIKVIAQATADCKGPYILSDKRFCNSGVVYYRYGGMRLNEILNVRGEKVPVLIAPDGTAIPDRRTPYFAVPAWARDPFEDSNDNDDNLEKSENTLKNGRYSIESALAFSNSGGVYLGRDTLTGRRVLIKEARPHVEYGSEAGDAVTMLKKEHRILCKLSGMDLAPEAVDIFEDWEHWFLIEEFIDGTPLGDHSAIHNIALRTRPTAASFAEFYDLYKELFMNIATLIESLRAQNIVFGDLSPNNLIVPRGTFSPRLIDFEGAYDCEIDPPNLIFTPGYASTNRIRNGDVAFEEDYYSLGALMFAYLLPLNSLFVLKPTVKDEVLERLAAHIALPSAIKDVILQLLSDIPAERPKPTVVIHVLAQSNVQNSQLADSKPVDKRQLSNTVDRITSYLLDSASYERKDRLFPANERVFTTNPLSVAYGACGICWALHKLGLSVPQPAMDWILQQDITNEHYPPGLFVGLAGIAWVLLDLGMEDVAKKLLKSASVHPLLDESPDLFWGLAGWGLANLYFFQKLENEIYLQTAKRAANQLLAMAINQDEGMCWKCMDDVHFGIAHGASGVALFFLYLYLITNDEMLVDVGLRAIDFDLSHAVSTRDNGLSWPYMTSNSEISPVLPYWRHGSTGVGTVLLRYYRLLKSSKHRQFLDQIFIDADRRFAVQPGRFYGLAGIGEFLLDLHASMDDDRYLRSAAAVADTILLFRLEKETGLAFPGDGLMRISCDFGTGSSGVGLFLGRLIGRKSGSDFMLDSLFGSKAAAVEKLKLGQSWVSSVGG